MANFTERVIFARVGWMTYYRGDRLESIIGGGSWEEKHEIFNFLPIGKRFYGFAQPAAGSSLELRRIDPNSTGESLESLRNVLVIFLAPRPARRGQVMVGWYRDAAVHGEVCWLSAKLGRPRRGYGYLFDTDVGSGVLLPTSARVHEIPRAKGATGQANVTYALDPNGRPLPGDWVQRAVEYVRSYEDPNLVTEPTVEADDEAAKAAAQVLDSADGQGHLLSSTDRKLIEEYAMSRAVSHYSKTHNVEVRGRPYDLLCRSKANPRSVLFVEVKGTQGDGRKIILTQNEVYHARTNKDCSVLFLVHSIKIESQSKSSRRIAKGGSIRTFPNWSPDSRRLTPIAYYYSIEE